MSKQVSDSESFSYIVYKNISIFIPTVAFKEESYHFCLNVDKAEFKNLIVKELGKLYVCVYRLYLFCLCCPNLYGNFCTDTLNPKKWSS